MSDNEISEQFENYIYGIEEPEQTELELDKPKGDLFIVGRIVDSKDHWLFLGIYKDFKTASEHCHSINYFVLPADLNVTLQGDEMWKYTQKPFSTRKKEKNNEI